MQSIPRKKRRQQNWIRMVPFVLNVLPQRLHVIFSEIGKSNRVPQSAQKSTLSPTEECTCFHMVSSKINLSQCAKNDRMCSISSQLELGSSKFSNEHEVEYPFLCPNSSDQSNEKKSTRVTLGSLGRKYVGSLWLASRKSRDESLANLFLSPLSCCKCYGLHEWKLWG